MFTKPLIAELSAQQPGMDGEGFEHFEGACPKRQLGRATSYVRHAAHDVRVATVGEIVDVILGQGSLLVA